MLGDEADGLGEDADRLLLGLVLAATVRGLDDDVVRVGEDGGIADDRGVAPAEVAGEDDRALRGDRTRALASGRASRMIAEPRMWPASRNVANTPGATSRSSS